MRRDRATVGDTDGRTTKRADHSNAARGAASVAVQSWSVFPGRNFG